MKRAIILHGMPEKGEYEVPGGHTQSEQHWLPWLRDELAKAGIEAYTPELPEPYAPAYEKWRVAFERFPVDKDTALIGHSCGAGFLARWLTENKKKVGKIALVAPWMDPAPRTLVNGFFEFVVDPEIAERAASISIFSSEDDDKDIHESVGILKAAWPEVPHMVFRDKGHFTEEDMGTREFPELRDEILG